MGKLLSRLKDMLTDIPAADTELDIEETRRIILLRMMFILGVVLLVPFGVNALLKRILFVAALDLAISVFLTAGLILLRRPAHYVTVGRVAVLLMAVLFLYLLATGGIGGTGYLWSYVFPLIALFFLGTRLGGVVVALFMLAAAVLLWTPGWHPTDFRLDLQIRFLASLFAVSLISFLFEYTRSRTHHRLLYRTRELEDAMRGLSTTQNALKENEQKYRSLVERANEGIVIVQDGTVRYANAHFAELSGRTTEELEGTPFVTLLPPEYHQTAAENFRKRMAGEDVPQSYEIGLLRTDGTVREVEVSGGLIDYEGKLGDMVLVRDITYRKRNEEEKAKLELELVESQKLESIGRLAGGIAHDFNNILGAIAGYAEMILMKVGEHDDALKKYATRISEGARRAADLTSKLLAFARKGAFEVVPVNVHHVISDMRKLLMHSVDKQIEIVPDLQASAIMVTSDPSQLREALLSVALNACDAMPEGGRLVLSTEDAVVSGEEATARKLREGQYIRICISDTGVGMDESIQRHMFEPFFTTKERGRGTGLGLASVYGIVTGIRGAIDVQSRLGEGTTVDIVLPISSSTPSELKAESPRRTDSSGGGTILVVDDEESVRDMCAELFGSKGYSVAVCRDGREAVEFYRKHRQEIDVVILDLVMPRVSGLECFRKLREMDPSVKVIVSSGNVQDEDARKIVREGAWGLVQKPFDLRELNTIIQNAIKGART